MVPITGKKLFTDKIDFCQNTFLGMKAYQEISRKTKNVFLFKWIPKWINNRRKNKDSRKSQAEMTLLNNENNYTCSAKDKHNTEW